MASMKITKANPGSRKEIDLFCRLAPLTEITVSTMNQNRERKGENTSRNNRVPNPASVRLNPKIKSKLAPRMRQIVS
jgi:hypothetical protein